MAWLANELEAAQTQHQKVWLVYHIPPGVDAYATTHAKQAGSVITLWKEPYTIGFLSLLAQYSGVVSVSLAGHIHADDFRLPGNSAIIIAPPVSPITGQNPTFRVVETDSHGTLKDQRTYYLKNFGELEGAVQPDWQLEYGFGKKWGLHGLNALNYGKLSEQIGTSAIVAAQWRMIYSTSNPERSSVTPANFSRFYCTISHFTAKDYQACVTLRENSGTTAN